MAYEKHTWETGEVITAEKLNNLEEGCSNSFLTMLAINCQHEDDNYYPCMLTSGSDTIRGQFTVEHDTDTNKPVYIVTLYKDGTVDDFDNVSDYDTEEEKQALLAKYHKVEGAVEYVFKDSYESNLAAIYKAKLGRDYATDKKNNTISSDFISVFF